MGAQKCFKLLYLDPLACFRFLMYLCSNHSLMLISLKSSVIYTKVSQLKTLNMFYHVIYWIQKIHNGFIFSTQYRIATCWPLFKPWVSLLKLTRQSNCGSNFYRNFKVLFWLSFVYFIFRSLSEIVLWGIAYFFKLLPYSDWSDTCFWKGKLPKFVKADKSNTMTPAYKGTARELCNRGKMLSFQSNTTYISLKNTG